MRAKKASEFRGNWSRYCVIKGTSKKSNFRSVDLKLEQASGFPRGLVKAQIPGPTPDFLTLQVWDGTRESAFLPSSQVVLVSPPPFENPLAKMIELSLRVRFQPVLSDFA